MYDIKFATVTGSVWGERVEVINDTTNAPLADVDTGTIELQVQDQNNSVVLFATTADGSITRPATGEIQWKFTVSQLGKLRAGNQYRLGCRHYDSDPDEAATLFTGSLAYIDGEFEWR